MTTLSPAVLSPMTSCGTVVTADGRTLPLRATRLVVRAAAGLARVQLVQTFGNPFAEPLHVTYRLPLPADAAVGGFRFRLGDQHIQGEIDRRAAARERFEQAIAQGRTAALLEQDRSALFTQELGNLPPGAELEAVIDVDQPLVWIDGSWQWRFPTTVAPRYLGADGRVDDAARQTVAVVDPQGPTIAPRCELDLVIEDVVYGAGPTSPSHPLHVTEVAGGLSVAFAAAAGRAAMDRDVVVSWPVAAQVPGVTLRTSLPALPGLSGQAFGLMTIVPPAAADRAPRLPRDLVVLLDISGSMAGAPLAQAQQVTCELIRSLGSEDRLELMAFSTRPVAWTKGPVAANAQNRAAAEAWVRGLVASGGTEMHTAILQALASLRHGAQRQVVVVTDGLIGFESEVVGAIRTGLPANSRVHVVGVGSATNRTLTRGASRAGRGIEVLVGIDEAAGPAAQRLLARTVAPLVQGLEVTGSALVALAPRALPDLFAGAPVRIAVQLRPEGGTLHVRGEGPHGAFVHELVVPPLVAGGDPAIARGFAREAVEDLEVELAATRAAHDVDARIEQLGLAHRIATRLTSWIAVSEVQNVDPRLVQRRDVVPQELPYGMAIEQLGLRRTMAMPCQAPLGGADAEATLCMPPSPPAAPRMRMREQREERDEAAYAADEVRASEPAPSKAKPAKKDSFVQRLFGRGGGGGGGTPRATLRLRNATEWVFEITGLAAWQVPASVVVVFADGSEQELVVDPARTTAAAVLGAGAVVRLVLQVGVVPVPATVLPLRLRLTLGGASIDVPVA